MIANAKLDIVRAAWVGPSRQHCTVAFFVLRRKFAVFTAPFLFGSFFNRYDAIDTGRRRQDACATATAILTARNERSMESQQGRFAGFHRTTTASERITLSEQYEAAARWRDDRPHPRDFARIRRRIGRFIARLLLAAWNNFPSFLLVRRRHPSLRRRIGTFLFSVGASPSSSCQMEASNCRPRHRSSRPAAGACASHGAVPRLRLSGVGGGGQADADCAGGAIEGGEPLAAVLVLSIDLALVVIRAPRAQTVYPATETRSGATTNTVIIPAERELSAPVGSPNHARATTHPSAGASRCDSATARAPGCRPRSGSTPSRAAGA